MLKLLVAKDDAETRAYLGRGLRELRHAVTLAADGRDALFLATGEAFDAIGDVAESFLPSIEDGGRALTRTIAPAITVEGNCELIAQAISNLLDYATRHTGPGVPIAVGLAPANDNAVVSVGDGGPGVPAHEQARVWTRFARLERSRSTPGYGLGLALVAAVACARGGDVALKDNYPELRVMMTLPWSTP